MADMPPLAGLGPRTVRLPDGTVTRACCGLYCTGPERRDRCPYGLKIVTEREDG